MIETLEELIRRRFIDNIIGRRTFKELYNIPRSSSPLRLHLCLCQLLSRYTNPITTSLLPLSYLSFLILLADTREVEFTLLRSPTPCDSHFADYLLPIQHPTHAQISNGPKTHFCGNPSPNSASTPSEPG
jgi:hypothetical protein